VTDSIPLPSPANFLLRSALYEFYAIGPSDRETVQNILYFAEPLDAYCVDCEGYSIFRRTFPANTTYLDSSEILRTRIADAQFACSRNEKHTLWFRIKTMKTEAASGDTEEEITVIGKVGQWPTVADLHTFEVIKYRGLLGPERYRELTRAIGLAAHGVGIGSFVYLRRIFEMLIEEAHDKARADGELDEATYQQSRMDERIHLLAHFLPSFLVENRSLYAILSTGIHSLTEKECLQHFDTVRAAIELILDERLEELRRAAKIKAASVAIAKARGEIKG